MVIRPAVAADLPAVQAVHRAAFPSDLEARLVGDLHTAGRLTLSYLAAEGGAIVGHVALSPLNPPGGLGLAPLAVLPTHQRRGVGQALVRAALDAARAAGWGFVVVLGDPAYYARFGFRPAAQWGLHDEYGGGEAFQVLELVAGAAPRDAGLVRYAPEFSLFAAQ